MINLLLLFTVVFFSFYLFKIKAIKKYLDEEKHKSFENNIFLKFFVYLIKCISFQLFNILIIFILLIIIITLTIISLYQYFDTILN